MKINAPSTTVKGQTGQLLIEEVDFKTKQDVVARLTPQNVRFLPKSVTILSRSVDTLSNGATVICREVDPTAFTDATITLTSNGTAPANGVTVTLAGKVYTFQTSLTNVDGNVLIGASAAAALDNLKSAVNLTAGAGTTYATAMTAHTKVSATTNTDTTQVFVSSVSPYNGRAGNDLTGADDSATLSWSGSGSFAGGIDGTLVNALVASTDLIDSDDNGNTQELVLATNYEVILGGNAFCLSITTGSTATTDTKDVVIEYLVVD